MKSCAELRSWSLERGEAVFSVRYGLNFSSIARKVTGKAISRLLRDKYRKKKQYLDIYETKTRNKSEPERPEKQLMA